MTSSEPYIDWGGLTGGDVKPLLDAATQSETVSFGAFTQIVHRLRCSDCAYEAFFPALTPLLQIVEKVDEKQRAYSALADLIYLGLTTSRCPDGVSSQFEEAIDRAKAVFAGRVRLGPDERPFVHGETEHQLMDIVAILAILGKQDAAEGLKWFVMHFPDCLND